jgi:hypothetical protein
MADPSNYIVECYEDKKRGPNPQAGHFPYWYRIREWEDNKKKYKLHEGFGTLTVAFYYAEKYLGIEHPTKLPFVDTVFFHER